MKEEVVVCDLKYSPSPTVLEMHEKAQEEYKTV